MTKLAQMAWFMLAATTVAAPSAAVQAQTLGPPRAGLYYCGTGSAPSPGGTTGRTQFGSSQARLVLDGTSYVYTAGTLERRGTYRYDGAGKLLFLTGDMAGRTADWELSPFGNPPQGRLWFSGHFCGLAPQ